MHRIVVLSVVATLGISACIPLPGGRELSRRQVWRKVGEGMLIAGDGGQCQVTPDRFERTRVGDRVICAWLDRDEAGSEPLRPAALP